MNDPYIDHRLPERRLRDEQIAAEPEMPTPEMPHDSPASPMETHLECPVSKQLTAIIHREDNGFVALCPELDVASQGDTIESARDNLREALELFFECASPAELQQRMDADVFVTQVEVTVG